MTIKSSPLLSGTRYFPEDSLLLQREIINAYVDIANAVNAREIGIYSLQQEVTGQKFFIQRNSASSDVGRKCFQIPSILNGTTTIPHGIDIQGITVFTHIYGTATNPSTSFLPIPYVNVGTPANGIQLSVNATNIVLTTTSADYTAYSAVIILEFVN